MSHDDDNDVYDITLVEFDDVTAFKSPGYRDTGKTHVRMYDAEAGTLLYESPDGSLALREAGEFSA